MKRLAAIAAVLALSLSACGDDEGYVDELKVTKTSNNTWTIYDPNDSPDAYIDRTCQTEGREVENLTAPGEAYGWLYVTCGPAPDASPIPDTDDDPYDSGP